MIFVAEIGINHSGDIGLAKELIKAAKLAGCDYVKFQKRDPDQCIPEHQKEVMRETPWGKMTYLDYKKRMEFSLEDYQAINTYCKEIGILWFASIWDANSAAFFKWNFPKLPFVKVPSCCNTNLSLLEKIQELNIPIILSTGMTSYTCFINLTNTVRSQNIKYILACTSTYPTPPEEVNLGFIKTLKEQYPNHCIGFSNHSPGLTAMLGAAAMGAEMIEMHITLDRSMWGTDQAASIEPMGIMKAIHHAKQLEQMMGNGEWTVFPGEQEAINRLRR